MSDLDELLALTSPNKQGALEQLLGMRPETQRARTFASGVTLGSADEIEAGVRAPFSNRGYEELRDEIRGKVDAYRKDRPSEALAFEAAGAAVPALFTTGRTGPLSYGQLARQGAGLGGAAGFGYSTGESPEAIATDTAGGAVVGALTNPAMAYGGQKIGNFVTREGGAFYGWLKSKIGDRPANAVSAELQRLAGDTGKTLDEIVDGIASGSIMAEDRNLTAAVRAYMSEGGEAGAFVASRIPERAAKTRQDAMKAVGDALGESSDENIVKIFRASDEELRNIERESYKKVFSGSDVLPDEINNTAIEILRRHPDAREELARIYAQDRTLVPLFKVEDNGRLVFSRAPNLEDMEILRRRLDESATNAFQARNGRMGEAFAQDARELRGLLDENFPDLQATRQQARNRREARDAFELGQRRGMSMPIDELLIELEEATPVKLEALRAGMLASFRNQANRRLNVFERAADPQRQEGMALRAATPEAQVDEVINRVRIAADSQNLSNRVLQNSMTAPQQAAKDRIGSVGDAFQILRASKGDPTAMVSLTARALKSLVPDGLPDNVRLQVVKTLFEENPALVRRALVDEDFFTAMMDQLATRMQAVARNARGVSLIEQGRGTAEIMDQSMRGLQEGRGEQ